MRRSVQEIKRRLRQLGIHTLSVHKGRGTGVGWTEIQPRHKPGDYREFTEEERAAIEKIFGQPAGGNFFCIIDAQAEMILGLREKRPICSICGCIHPTQEGADSCWMNH